jgi:arylsulfatase A-like enzyme
MLLKSPFILVSVVAALLATATGAAAQEKPNILIIWGDDVGMWNISAYHREMMGGETPNIDRIAADGKLFMDHYAHASCTAGRAAFITGQHPHPRRSCDRGPARLADRTPARRPHAGHDAQGARLSHRPVRQEPPRRPR